MRVILLPFLPDDTLLGFHESIPEALLPIVNKPLIEHLLELLVRYRIKAATLCLRHLPYETAQYCGDGARWSLQLTYTPGDFDSFAAALERLGRQPQEPYLCLPLRLVTDLDLNRFQAAHQEGGAAATVCQFGATTEALTVTAPQALQGVVGAPLILSPAAVRALFSFEPFPDMAALCAALQAQGLLVKTYQTTRRGYLIQSWPEYRDVQLRILRREFQTITIPGKEVSPGVWLGRNCVIAPTATLQPPVLIGHNSAVKANAKVTASVIGEGVIIEENVEVRQSIVLADTYVGSNLNVNEMVVHKTCVVQISTGVDLCVTDEVILGDLRKRDVSGFLERSVNVSVAVLLLVLFSPLLLSLWIYSLLRPSQPYIVAVKRYRPAGAGNPGTGQVVAFSLYTSRSRWRLLQKLPGLINVIRGDLNLVGNSPLTEAELTHTQEDWEKLRLQAPSGLFHIWEAEGSPEASWQEKIVMEGYYAVQRSLWGDVKIFFKSLFSPSR